MKVRRKSLHRSTNAKRAKKFAAMRAAKERKRVARLSAEPTMPDMSHVYHPTPRAPLFVISIRCRDGAIERLNVFDCAQGLRPAATLAGRKVAAVLSNYRPA